MKKIVSLFLAVSMLFSMSLVSVCATVKDTGSDVDNGLLESVAVDKNLLSYAISTATSYYMSMDNFSGYSWSVMLDKLENANKVYRNENATQAEVYLATEELFDAVDGLERIRESGLKRYVVVDVSAVKTGDESFWVYVWSDKDPGHWEETLKSDSGRLIVFLGVGEYALFTRMGSGKQPDWFLVLNQTEETRYTGQYNCAVLSYCDTTDGMSVEWKNLDTMYRRILIKTMLVAEKYLFNEADKYTAESIANLQNAYLDALDFYKSATTQAQFDNATQKLNDAIFNLVLKDESVTGDKTLLLQAISTATSYYMSLDKFTYFSWNVMIQKLEDANEVYRNENASQAEVDLATQELQNAIDSLVRVDKIVGDADGDGEVGVVDATLIQRHIAELDLLDEDRLECVDIDKDSKVTIMDATLIQRFIAQLIPKL